MCSGPRCWHMRYLGNRLLIHALNTERKWFRGTIAIKRSSWCPRRDSHGFCRLPWVQPPSWPMTTSPPASTSSMCAGPAGILFTVGFVLLESVAQVRGWSGDDWPGALAHSKRHPDNGYWKADRNRRRYRSLDGQAWNWEQRPQHVLCHEQAPEEPERACHWQHHEVRGGHQDSRTVRDICWQSTMCQAGCWWEKQAWHKSGGNGWLLRCRTNTSESMTWKVLVRSFLDCVSTSTVNLMDTGDGWETITLDPRQRDRDEKKLRTHADTAVLSRLSRGQTRKALTMKLREFCGPPSFCAKWIGDAVSWSWRFSSDLSSVSSLTKSPQNWRLRRWNYQLFLGQIRICWRT